MITLPSKIKVVVRVLLTFEEFCLVKRYGTVKEDCLVMYEQEYVFGTEGKCSVIKSSWGRWNDRCRLTGQWEK